MEGWLNVVYLGGDKAHNWVVLLHSFGWADLSEPQDPLLTFSLPV